MKKIFAFLYVVVSVGAYVAISQDSQTTLNKVLVFTWVGAANAYAWIVATKTLLDDK